MVDDYTEVKERQRRDVVPKAKGNTVNEWKEAVTVESCKKGGGFPSVRKLDSPPGTPIHFNSWLSWPSLLSDNK